MSKKILVIRKFKDLKCGNVIRLEGSTLNVDEERAEMLVERGFAKYVEEAIPEPKKEIIEIETAVKEEKKETAVKEKAVKPKKATRKNAKK